MLFPLTNQVLVLFSAAQNAMASVSGMPQYQRSTPMASLPFPQRDIDYPLSSLPAYYNFH